MKANKLCLKCGTVGTTKRFMKGSILIELFLWFLFIVPGLIYSIWRHSSVYQGCRKCGSSEVIPLDSPRARSIQSGGSKSEEIPNESD